MNEEYFEWLLNRIGVDSNDPNGYELLCSVLYDTAFYPLVEMDENRWKDGIRYRLIFANEIENGRQPDTNMTADYLDDMLGGCTALELILAMAERMQYEMEGSRYDAPVYCWFCELISNTGLDIYTNDELLTNENAYFEIEDILNRLIFRHYDYSGEGGLFPLSHPMEDQTRTELVIQMNNYLLENYDILN